jgi:two-component system sensor histidine kinase VicK
MNLLVTARTSFYILVAAIGLFLGCKQRSNIPLGTRAFSDSVLVPREPLFESGRLTEALHYVDSAFHSLSNPTVYNYLGYYNTQAYVNAVRGDHHAQMRYIDSAIELVEQQKLDQQMSMELANLKMARADAHFNLKNYKAVFDDYFEAMQVAKTYSDNCGTMNVIYNIAMILYKQQQFLSSARYFQEAMAYSNICDQNPAYRNNKEQEILDNIGLCFTKLKKYDSAMYYYQAALDIVMKNRYGLAVDSNNSIGRQKAAAAVITGNMAKIYVGTNKPDSAIAVYKRAIAYNNGADIHDMQLCMIQLSDVYLSQKQYGNMKQTLDQLRNSLNKSPGKDLEMDYDRLMYAYHQYDNNAVKALYYLGNYIQKRDSTAEQQKHLLQSDIGQELREKEQQFEIELLQKNNQLNRTYLWVLVTISIMAIVIIVLTYVSYKTSKKNVRKLTELNTEISNTNKEKDRILRVVAHDLRNPIGGIASLSQILLTSDMDKEKQQEFIRKIEMASTSSISLINELLSKQYLPGDQNSQLKSTNIGQMLQQAVYMMQLKADEKQQTINLETPSQPVSILIDAVKTERVINNLINNAIKFSPENSSIDISLRIQRKDITIIVTDHGIGMSPEQLEHVFDQSNSVKRAGTAGEASFGLGLSICKQIIEDQGGSIWAESSQGKGSRFYVKLPIRY